LGSNWKLGHNHEKELQTISYIFFIGVCLVYQDPCNI
jgi:hypothetical protein